LYAPTLSPCAVLALAKSAAAAASGVGAGNLAMTNPDVINVASSSDNFFIRVSFLIF
jgi:hypothetical protein